MDAELLDILLPQSAVGVLALLAGASLDAIGLVIGSLLALASLAGLGVLMYVAAHRLRATLDARRAARLEVRS